jgi:DNA-binding NarL/FixJ family response regulator
MPADGAIQTALMGNFSRRRWCLRAAAPILASMQSTLPPATRVFLVEDFAPIRERLVGLLDEIEGVQVIGEADTACAAAAGILYTRPQAVVLDIHLAQGSGIDVLRAVRPHAPEIVFIVLTNLANPQYQKICMGAGASHFVDKSTEMAEVMQLVSTLAASQRHPIPANNH